MIRNDNKLYSILITDHFNSFTAGACPSAESFEKSGVRNFMPLITCTGAVISVDQISFLKRHM